MSPKRAAKNRKQIVEQAGSFSALQCGSSPPPPPEEAGHPFRRKWGSHRFFRATNPLPGDGGVTRVGGRPTCTASCDHAK